MIKRIWISKMALTLGLILVLFITDVVLYQLFNDSQSGRVLYDPGFLSDPHTIIMSVVIFFSILIFGILNTNKTVAAYRSEAELSKRTEDYRLIAENSNDVIWKMNREGKFLYVSPSVEKLRGYTPDEVKQQSFEEFLTPASYKLVKDLISQMTKVMAENPGKYPSVLTQIEQPKKGGGTVWTEVSVNIVKGKNEKTDFFIGVSRDITRRKSQEEDLRRSEKYYRLLAETSLDFIFVHDMDGSVLYTNPTGLSAAGYTSEEISGRNIKELVPDTYHPEIEKLWKKRRQGNFDTFRYELALKTKEGKEIPLEVSSAPIMLNKTPISMIVSARDITERKESERKSREVQDKIKKINTELEEKVKERTRLLEESYKELESFSYSVSHDLRAPLRHIDLFTRLLAKKINEGNGEKSAEFLDSIIESTHKMKELIDSLLHLSRTSRSEMKLDDFDMNQLVNHLIKDIEQEGHGRICWNVAELGEVKADIRLIRQVWYNLISNSLKFSQDQEEIKIQIGRFREGEMQGWFIKDNGVGFDMNYKEKLFGVFQRLHSEDEFEGNGIGLATVKRIIDRHKGRIWGESLPGEGATFYFTIR